MIRWTLVAAFVALALPPAALGWRGPSRSERGAVVRAARRADADRSQRIRVHDIRISTVGPWATADVELYRRGSSRVEQAEVDIFDRVHGAWLDDASSNAPATSMPPEDERNLELNGPPPFGGVYFQVYLLLGWLVGLAGLFDVALQPRAAFSGAGHSKWRWLLIELVGLLPAGLFTWAVYALTIRPKVVRSGGRRPRKILRGLLEVMSEAARSDTSGGTQTGQAPPNSQPDPSHSQQFDPWRAPALPSGPRRCPAACTPPGRAPCPECGRSGKVVGPGGTTIACPVCHGRLLTCLTCNGRGYAMGEDM